MATPLALVASGLIALSSCSGQSSSSASVSAGTVGAPTASIRVGPLAEEFATALPDDPAKAKVVEAWRESQIIWEKSVQGWSVPADATAYYMGDALVRLHNAVSTDIAYHIILTGTNRLYQTSVTSLTAHSATLTACDDSTRVNDEDPSTGQKYPNAPGATLIFLTIWQLVPAGGHWAVTSYSLIAAPDPRERVCATS
jgi:hypothetical protein